MLGQADLTSNAVSSEAVVAPLRMAPVALLTAGLPPNDAIACTSCAVTAAGGSLAMPATAHSKPTCPMEAADVIALLLMS
jgi:hypothetical protein